MTRDEMIADCAHMYAVHPRLFRDLTKAQLETAWLTARAHEALTTHPTTPRLHNHA